MRIYLYRILQNVDCLRKFILPTEQGCRARGQLGFSWIDVQNFAVSFQGLINFAVFLECCAFDEMGEGLGLTQTL